MRTLRFSFLFPPIFLSVFAFHSHVSMYPFCTSDLANNIKLEMDTTLPKCIAPLVRVSELRCTEWNISEVQKIRALWRAHNLHAKSCLFVRLFSSAVVTQMTWLGTCKRRYLSSVAIRDNETNPRRKFPYLLITTRRRNIEGKALQPRILHATGTSRSCFPLL